MVKTIIEAVQKPYEMPSQTSGSADFGLSDINRNRVQAHLFLARADKLIFEETDEYVLFRCGEADVGYIALYSKILDRLDYFVKFETMNRKLTGFTVTQVALWRTVALPYIPDITSKMFFEYLLPTYGAVMSDEQHSDKGRDFWIRTMALAAHKGMTVGFVDFRGSKVEIFDPSEHGAVDLWAKTRGAWGKGDKFRDRRFVIRDGKWLG